MHRLVLAASLGIALLLPLVLAAQEPSPAFITVKEVEVRSGPSDKFPATGKLVQNDRVLIRGKANSGEVLQIAPPAGSFSWVRDKDVQAGSMENGKQVLNVTADEAHIRAGIAGRTEPLNARTATAKKGTKLIAREGKVNVAIEKEEWWPIECVEGESRFIPASAVQKPAVASDAPPLPRAAPGAAQDPPQWALADQAQREGRLDDAERLFSDIVRNNAGSGGDFELSLRAQNRIREIRLQRRTMLTSRPGGNGNSTLIPPQPGVPAFTPPSDRLPPRPALPLPRPGMSRTATAGPNNGSESSGPGWLRRSGFQIDRKQTYALESANGQLRVYVTAESGVDLEAHLNRPVELFGTFEVRGDVRGASYMRVARVVPLR